MPRAARNKKLQEAEVEASLIPIMSCMFLLIPALLLAMEVARHASIPISVPHFCNHTSDPPTDPPLPPFSVRIRSDGFSTGQGTAPPEIDIPHGADGRHDFATLQARAAGLHAANPGRYTVHLSAEGDVELDTVVKTMDALRGPDCSLKGALAGEAAGEGCNFWNVVIES